MESIYKGSMPGKDGRSLFLYAQTEGQNILDLETEDGGKLSDFLKPHTPREDGFFFDVTANISALFESFMPPVISDVSGVTLEFIICHEDEAYYRETVKSIQITDPSGIYENAPPLKPEEYQNGDTFPVYPFLNDQQQAKVTPALRAALDVINILVPVLINKLNDSQRPFAEKEKFFAYVANRILKAITRRSKEDRDVFILRGQKGAKGSESFKKTVRAFAEKMLVRLNQVDRAAIPVERETIHDICEDIVAAHASTRTLASMYGTGRKKSPLDFLRQIQEAAKNAAIDRDSGNGLSAFSMLLSFERNARRANRPPKTKRTKDIIRWDPPKESKELILPPGADLETGYFPRGRDGGAFAIYGDVVLNALNVPTEGKAGAEEIKAVEDEIHDMASIRLTSKITETEASVPNYGFLSTRKKEGPGKRDRAVWLIWDINDAFQFPEPIPRGHGYSYQPLNPIMYSEINKLGRTAGMKRGTIGLLCKVALVIHSSVQTQFDANEAQAKAKAKRNKEPLPTSPVVPFTKINIKRAKLPLPENRRDHKKFLEVLKGGLAAVGIELLPDGHDFIASRDETKIAASGLLEL